MARAKTSQPSEDLLSRIADQIDLRLEQLRPAVEEHAELTRAAVALGLDADSVSPRPRSSRRRVAARRSAGAPAAAVRGARRATRRAVAAPRGSTQKAIVAALEHGSHTLGELTSVTALSAPGIRKQLAPLVDSGLVKRARRGGKSAYMLARTLG